MEPPPKIAAEPSQTERAGAPEQVKPLAPLDGGTLTEKSHNLGDSLAFGALAITALTWALSPTLLEKAMAIVAGGGLLAYLAYKSHFTRNYPRHSKHVIAALFLLAALAGGGWQLWSQWKREKPEKQNAVLVPDGSSGDTFPLLKDDPRPFLNNPHDSSPGNLKARLISLADKIDAYQTSHPEPAESDAAIAGWNHARSEDFRENILESLVDIHDELNWFHYRDADLDTLLGIESYKEQINEHGGMSDDLTGKDTTLPKHKLDASSGDLDKIAKRLRALADQVKSS